jgi:hypothetical protein
MRNWLSRPALATGLASRTMTESASTVGID